jgi:hypothetical protein
MSCKAIAKPPHVNLNMIYTNINTDKRDSSLKISTTGRVGNKFVTVVYYSPTKIIK